jgi:hypothetical protein
MPHTTDIGLLHHWSKDITRVEKSGRKYEMVDARSLRPGTKGELVIFTPGIA